MSISVEHFFDTATSTLTYIVWNSVSSEAVIIDPVAEYDQAASKLNNSPIIPVVDFLKAKNLKPLCVLETHAHADHVSGAQYIRKEYPDIQICIGDSIRKVQRVFGEMFNLGPDFKADGSQFDQLLTDGQDFQIGEFHIQCISTPGHTPACMTYCIDDHCFMGDLMFMPDSGTGRCDFPDGDAKTLYQSVQKLYALGDSVQLYTGHDYQPDGRELKYRASVGEQKEQNKHIKASTTEADFVKMRTERDRNLKVPRLLLPSIQLNIRAGQLPPEAANGKSYLQIPVENQ